MQPTDRGRIRERPLRVVFQSTRNLEARRPAPAGYELHRWLGGGGMGDVYLAREHSTQRLMAMKFLRSASNPKYNARFDNEIKALGRLDHPNIVRVISVELERSDPFFTMEFAASGTLAEQIRADGPLEPRAAALLTVKLARAVQVTHAAAIFHRDIKPSNIILAADGTPKLSDFGLAKLTDLEEEDALTNTTQAIGTPPFMPPEQCSRLFGKFGPGTDVYGLGATLYAMLTGKAPFEGDTNEDVLLKVRNDAPPRPRSLRPEIPLALEGIVLKCLEKQQSDRYASAEALAADLERFLDGETTVAPELTWLRRVRVWGYQRRRTLVGVLVAVLAIGGVAWGIAERQASADPLRSMDRNLDAGREVVLVPERGLPSWHEWQIGAPELIAGADGACQFEALGHALLELCRDPRSESYRIRADIRYRHSKVAGPGDVQEGVTQAGIYFGRTRQIGDRVQVDAFLATSFAEVPKVPDPPGKMVQFRGILLYQQPNKNVEQAQSGIRALKFVQAETLPGPYRTLEIDVTPERVRVLWIEEEKSGLIAEITVDALRVKYRKLSEKFAALPPGHGLSDPEWSPRLPLGIWCNRASLEIKNVRLIPQ